MDAGAARPGVAVGGAAAAIQPGVAITARAGFPNLHIELPGNIIGESRKIGDGKRKKINHLEA